VPSNLFAIGCDLAMKSRRNNNVDTNITGSVDSVLEASSYFHSYGRPWALVSFEYFVPTKRSACIDCRAFCLEYGYQSIIKVNSDKEESADRKRSC
jgi:hypothetical protein